MYTTGKVDLENTYIWNVSNHFSFLSFINLTIQHWQQKIKMEGSTKPISKNN